MKNSYPIWDKRFVYTRSEAHSGNADYLRARFREIREQLEVEKKAKVVLIAGKRT